MDNTEPTSETRKVITVESLLQLKRLEQPPAEFWSEFDRRFEQKRLQALVSRPSMGARFAAILGVIASPSAVLAGASVAAVALLLVGNGFFTGSPGFSPVAVAQSSSVPDVAASSLAQSASTVSVADMQAGSRTAFAVDTLSLERGNRGTVATADRLSTGHGGSVFFATGSISTAASAGVSGFY
jgi:hypothetical protein